MNKIARNKILQITKEHLNELYILQNMSVNEIAKLFELSHCYNKQIIKKI